MLEGSNKVDWVLYQEATFLFGGVTRTQSTWISITQEFCKVYRELPGSFARHSFDFCHPEGAEPEEVGHCMDVGYGCQNSDASP